MLGCWHVHCEESSQRLASISSPITLGKTNRDPDRAIVFESLTIHQHTGRETGLRQLLRLALDRIHLPERHSAVAEFAHPSFALRLSFEWGGGILWADNAASRDRFDVGAIEDQLPLSPQLRQQLEQLSHWHDTALNWDDPAGPSPWTVEESDRFEVAAQAALQALKQELGPNYSIRYQPL